MNNAAATKNQVSVRDKDHCYSQAIAVAITLKSLYTQFLSSTLVHTVLVAKANVASIKARLPTLSLGTAIKLTSKISEPNVYKRNCHTPNILTTCSSACYVSSYGWYECLHCTFKTHDANHRNVTRYTAQLQPRNDCATEKITLLMLSDSSSNAIRICAQALLAYRYTVHTDTHTAVVTTAALHCGLKCC
jgi:hypothetical protein